MSKPTRRDFLKQAATAAAGIYGLGAITPNLSAAPKPTTTKEGKSRVVIARSPGLMADSQGMVNQKVVNGVVNDSLVALTGAASPEAAWKSIFKPTDVVGVKINCLFAKGASTRPEVVMAVVAGLQSAGVKPENILIWDRSTRDLMKAGYTPCKEPGKVQCYGTDNDYDAEPTKLGSFNGKMAAILSKKITALVNVPILKDHSGAGITLAMKNHYGSFHNPGAHHGNNCDPFIADLNTVPAIRNKTRLIVCDMITPICNGGPHLKPEYQWNYKGIMTGFDPVAVDSQGWIIVEEQRKKMGLPTLTEAGRPPKWIAGAAQRNLGTNDPAKMEIVRI